MHIQRNHSDPNRDIEMIQKELRDNQKKWYFQKRIGFKGQKPPNNMDQLKEEIKKWPRVGMGDPRNIIEKAGFKRRHDYDHTYKKDDRSIKEDTDKLIQDGLLVEF